MKKILVVLSVFFAALFIASCSSSEEASVETGGIKGPPPVLTNRFVMLSVNAQHGLKDRADVVKFANWIKSTGAELVAVQRIERATESKPEFDAYSVLLKQLDMRGTFAKARYLQGWDSGNALFCLYPILQSNVYMLPTGKGKARRSLSFGVFEMGLRSMAFASTDLDGDDLSERQKQVAEIFAIRRSIPEFPVIVAGFFGESAKGKVAAKMGEQFISANTASESTAGLEQHVYLPQNAKMKVIAAEKVSYKPLNTTGIIVTVEVTQ